MGLKEPSIFMHDRDNLDLQFTVRLAPEASVNDLRQAVAQHVGHQEWEFRIYRRGTDVVAPIWNVEEDTAYEYQDRPCTRQS